MFCFNGSFGFLCLVLIGTSESTPPLQLDVQAGLPLKVEPSGGGPIDTKFRLPNTVIPSHYDLDIIPILDTSLGGELEFFAPGNVTIEVKCIEITNAITLHAQNISFTAADVTITEKIGGRMIPVRDVASEADIKTMTLAENLVTNTEYYIWISFSSYVSEDLDGLYRSYYTDNDGNDRYLATTQFEKTGARKAFPCFDEPALKATFNIRIGRRNDNAYHSLCNTEKIGPEEPIDGYSDEWVWDTYNTTVKMSTYLIAIIVSDFSSETAEPADLFRVPVKTWGPPNQMGDGSGIFSAQVAAKLLKFFEDYFQSPYQLNKLDSVAIPQFEAGAMENWGLNTYRIPLMLFFQNESTQFEQWRQAAVIAHEVSHHWFGDLVTMVWWNDLWLKEGFARYLQFLGVEGSEKQLQAMNRVVVDTVQIAMESDILDSSHPIRGSWTADIQTQSSRIIYEKGASLIRMMQGFLSEETLIAGLRTYLTNNGYGNTVQDQLFQILTAQAHADGTLREEESVKGIMESWTLQSGYPLVRVSRTSNTRIYLSQEPFGPVKANSDYNDAGTWEIPVTYATKAEPDFSAAVWKPKLWIHQNVVLKSHSVPTTEEWILVNPDARSYYRVLYDDDLGKLLADQLEVDHEVISPSSRSQLLDDYFASAYNSHIGIEKALDFTTYLHKETKLVVWTTALNQLRKAYTLLIDTNAIDKFKSYVGGKILPQLEVIGAEMNSGEDAIISMLRTQLLDWACSIGLEICHVTSQSLVRRWMGDPENNPIQPDIQPMIYCGAFANGDSAIRDFLIQQYWNNGLSTRNRGLLLSSIACGLDLNSHQEALAMAIDTANSMTTDDRKILVEKIAGNSVGRGSVLKFLTANRTEIISVIGADAISSSISVMSTYFSSPESVFELEDFLAANGDLSSDIIDSIKASIEKVKLNQGWMQLHFESIVSWMAPI